MIATIAQVAATSVLAMAPAAIAHAQPAADPVTSESVAAPVRPAVAPPAPAATDDAAEAPTEPPAEPIDKTPAPPVEPAPAPPEPAPIEPPTLSPTFDAESAAGPGFGTAITIDDIVIRGNDTTSDRLIRRVLPVTRGSIVRSGEATLRNARYKILALGFFRHVKLSLQRGSERGHVVLIIDVLERTTFALNRLWFGTSNSSTAWLGADVSERNFLGTGFTVGGAAVFANDSDIAGSRNQYAGEIRIAAPGVLNSRWSLGGSLTAIHGSEPFRINGEPPSDATTNFNAFSYSRIGGRAFATYELTAWSRVSFGARFERIDADVPAAPTRTLNDGTIAPVDLHLLDGSSHVSSISAGYDHDTRNDPVLPHDGAHLQLVAELSLEQIGSSYDFASLLARYDRFWSVRGSSGNTIALKLAGGIVLGNAPRFDLIHVADVDRMLTPRALGLVLAANSPPNFLGTRRPDEVYGDVGASAMVEYGIPLFRGGKHIYGGDIFVAAGLWGLTNTSQLQLRDNSVWQSLPIDLMFDAGLRLDTDLGIFEFTLANALGRAPL